MTDEPDSVDELISRYLDGEASEAEIVRVESDPALRARAESMRAAIEAIAAPVDIPTADLDRIRANALAASATSEQVTDLAAAAAARASAERRNRILAIAAAFVFLAVGVVAIRSLPGTDDDADTAGTDTTAESSTAEDASDDGGDDAGDEMAEESMSALSQDDMADADAAEDDDMAEMAEEEMAEEDGDATAADEGADSIESDAEPTEAPAEGGEQTETLDLLPDELEPVADATELVDVIVAAYDSEVDAENAVGRSEGELFAELCPGAALLLEEVQPAGTIGVEQTFVEVGGMPVTAVVGSGLDGSLVILTHAVDDCAIVITQAIIDGP